MSFGRKVIKQLKKKHNSLSSESKKKKKQIFNGPKKGPRIKKLMRACAEIIN